ncbi:hypothetical protein BIW11_13164 [Tropilaelaps mercedesae]|uniref:Uncharacterized protein n=1 Tax=Tropilaelaps mercedesae TaxID=418985 RepID=A0A1V9X3T5_9ACAR|nr:hypothetical protein BIW11_13164 [Tropilaelaps mercedesae]
MWSCMPRPPSESSLDSLASLLDGSSTFDVSKPTTEPSDPVLAHLITVSDETLCVIALPGGQQLIPLLCLLNWCQHDLQDLHVSLDDVGLEMAPLMTVGDCDGVYQAICKLHHHDDIDDKESLLLVPAGGAAMYLRVLGLHRHADMLQPFFPITVH